MRRVAALVAILVVAACGGDGDILTPAAPQGDSARILAAAVLASVNPEVPATFGQTLSGVGSSMSAIGVAVYVFIETGNALWLGALTALAALPSVLVAPFAGWIDRYPRRTVMLAADGFAAVGGLGWWLLSSTTCRRKPHGVKGGVWLGWRCGFGLRLP